MANCMLGFPNRTDQSVLSGGAWVSTLPRSNLQNRVIGKVARTVDTAATSTQFSIDLGSPKKTQLIGLRNHNFSLQATYRVTASPDSGFSTLAYDSGWLSVWPDVYPYGSLEWEDDNFWSGQYTDEEIDGYIAELDHILPTLKLARYWRVEINDTANAAGYIEIGRLFIGPAWQPKANMSKSGSSIAWETDTDVQKAIGGAEYFQRKPPYRVQLIALDWMDQDEAFSQAFELMRRAGVDQEILWIYDPDDTVHALRRRFLCRIRTLSPIQNPYATIDKTAYELKELQ